MIAFEIEIDGKKMVLAGVDDWSLLGFHVAASRREPNSAVRDGYIECSAHGLTTRNEDNVRYHFRWPTQALHVGNVVTVRIVDVPAADEPSKRYRSDREVQESPFTEAEKREMRYNDYLSLKAEFEPENDD